MDNADKHAYCLLIHQYDYILEVLLKLIDDARNDIFIHLDKKSQSLERQILSVVKKSRVVFANRVRVDWGTISLVRAEYMLYECAFQNGPYAYYHLLSGADLPIKSQDYIHDLCRVNPGTEFIEYGYLFPERHNYLWFFISSYKSDGVLKWLSKKFLRLQRLLKIKNTSFPIFYGGSEWASLTNEAVAEILREKKHVLRAFRFSFCPDEMYKQTVLKNASMKFGIAPSNMRLIDWNEGGPHPHLFVLSDWERIAQSGAFFCRKIKDYRLAERLLSELSPRVS